MKYVYFEPLNGFNDILCSIAKVFYWCKTHNRTLIVNGKKSTYKVNFYDYFYISDILFNPNILKDFKGTIYPPELQGKMADILNGQIVFKSIVNRAFYNKELELKNTDADVIIYSCGGGGYGLPTYRQLKFHPTLLTIMKERHTRLKPHYLCIHIRNTDYKCDYQSYFYQHEKKIRAFKEVYLCTDDVSTIDFYREKEIPVKNFATFPSQPYTSLHTSLIDPHIKMIDLLCDIYIAGLSQEILSNSEGGFIQLLISIHKSRMR